jgi:hypothetical protein
MWIGCCNDVRLQSQWESKLKSDPKLIGKVVLIDVCYCSHPMLYPNEKNTRNAKSNPLP